MSRGVRHWAPLGSALHAAARLESMQASERRPKLTSWPFPAQQRCCWAGGRPLCRTQLRGVGQRPSVDGECRAGMPDGVRGIKLSDMRPETGGLPCLATACTASLPSRTCVWLAHDVGGHVCGDRHCTPGGAGQQRGGRGAARPALQQCRADPVRWLHTGRRVGGPAGVAAEQAGTPRANQPVIRVGWSGVSTAPTR